jgi:hypothetical protein
VCPRLTRISPPLQVGGRALVVQRAQLNGARPAGMSGAVLPGVALAFGGGVPGLAAPSLLLPPPGPIRLPGMAGGDASDLNDDWTRSGYGARGMSAGAYGARPLVPGGLPGFVRAGAGGLGAAGDATPVLQLLNMVTPQDLVDDEEYRGAYSQTPQRGAPGRTRA